MDAVRLDLTGLRARCFSLLVEYSLDRWANTPPACGAGTKLTEMELPEEKVLEKLNAVSTAKRLANMVRALAPGRPRLFSPTLAAAADTFSTRLFL